MRVALFAVLAVLALPAAARAQTYLFSVPNASMDVDVRSDGTIGVDYAFEFQNSDGASAIDVVDVGMPNDDYDMSTMKAWVDNVQVSDISKSSYIETGVQVRLHDASIPPGASGQFAFHYEFDGLVFSDTTSDALASFRITPTWFDAGAVQGTTHLLVRVHLPSGVRPEEALTQGLDFDSKELDAQGRTVVGWEWGATELTGPHVVAVSFPRRGMTGITEITKLDLLLDWWASDAAITVRFCVALALFLIFSIGYFRFTALTGWVPWLVIGGLCAWLFYAHPASELVAIPVVPLLVWLMEATVRRRKRSYLPPIVSVEGGGVKRGLTAPEAAVLLEVPLARVLSMVVFGMLKKGLLVQVSPDPLRIAVAGPYHPSRVDVRRAAAAQAGVVVQEYENAFLDAILGSSPAAANDGVLADVPDFTGAVKALVQSVADRMVGFDVDDTKKYYRAIVERAWMDAKSVGEIAQRTATIDKQLEWLLVGDDYERRFGGFGGGYVYVPIWMRPAPTLSMPSLGGGATAGAYRGATGPTITPSFGDVSASFAGWFGGISNKMATTITPATKGGVLDLSGFDRATGAVLKAMATSRGGGGHGGGGCACAGCACACACAGGGR